jgi:hypothetical protein
MKKRKRGGKTQVGNLDISERIEKLKKEIEKLESILYLQQYFAKIKSYRGIYMVEMRRYFSVKLEQEGFSISEIGRIIGKHHSSVIHMLKENFNDDVTEVISANANKWVAEGLYPKSYATSDVSYLHPKGTRTVVKYKLIEL